MQTDLTIIGCGLAGLVELRQALVQKKTVSVVADGFGATQYTNGVFDVSEAQAFFDFYGVPVVCGAELSAIGPIGQIRPIGRNAAVLKTLAFTHVEALPIKKVLFVEIFGLPDFSAALVVPNLQKTFFNVRTVSFDASILNITSPHAHLLQLFDNESCGEVLRDFLQRNKGDAELVVIPPVLGIKGFTDIHQTLESDLGVRIVEQLSTTPPVAGLRFTHIVRKFFEDKKINVVWGDVRGYCAEDDEVRSLTVTTRQGEIKIIESKNFILATGKFLGGGISFEGGVREAIFDFPCSAGSESVSKNVPMTKLIQRDSLKEQEFLKLGVVVNNEGCPVDPISKKTIYKNVRAVGSVRGKLTINN